MESIPELRKMLQEEKVHPEGWRRPWGYATFQRGPSIYITRALLPYHITPNQVTVTGIIIGLFGCWILLQPEISSKFFGLILLYLNILSDKVDGEIARYKKTFSLVGVYWDEINHLVIPPLAWLSLTIGVLQISIFKEWSLIGAAAMGALALVVLRIVHSLPAQIFAKKYFKHPELFDIRQPAALVMHEVIPGSRWQKLREVGRILHYIQDFFILIFLSAICLTVESVFLRDYVFHPLLDFFILVASALLVLIALEVIIKKSRSVEREIQHFADHKAS